jgi:hypothetical protein
MIEPRNVRTEGDIGRSLRVSTHGILNLPLESAEDRIGILREIEACGHPKSTCSASPDRNAPTHFQTLFTRRDMSFHTPLMAGLSHG